MLPNIHVYVKCILLFRHYHEKIMYKNNIKINIKDVPPLKESAAKKT